MGDSTARNPREAAVTKKLVDAYAQPVRSAILLRLEARPASIGELSADAGEPRSTIRYHTRKLVAAGLIEIAGKRATRGTVETLYQPAVSLVLTDGEFRGLGIHARSQLTERAAALAFKEIMISLRSRTFGDRTNSTAIHARLFLDEQGWEEMSKIHLQAWERIEQVKTEAARRLGVRGETGIRSASTQFLYVLPDSEE